MADAPDFSTMVPYDPSANDGAGGPPAPVAERPTPEQMKEFPAWRPPDPEPSSTAESLGQQFGYGNISGVAGVAGAPSWVASKVTGKDVPGYSAITGALPTNLNPDDPNNQPRNFSERIARAAGQATGVTAGTGAVAATLPEDITAGAAGAVPAAIRTGQKLLTPELTGSGLVGAAASGAGSEAASEFVPADHPWLKGAANISGALAGGAGVGSLAAGLGRMGADTVERQGIAQVARDRGVDYPNFMTSSTGAGVGNVMSKIPFIGAPLKQAQADIEPGIGKAQAKTATDIGSGDRSIGAPKIGDAVSTWMDTTSGQKMENAYNYVARTFNKNPGVTTDPNNAMKVAQDILNERRTQATQMTPGIEHVLNAVTTPGGLSWDEMKLLRTELWNVPNSGSNDVKRLWGALGDDMSEAAFQQGGLRGQYAASQANKLAQGIYQRRDQLQQLMGSGANESLYDTMLRTASAKGGGNIENLLAAKKTLSSQDWDELASGAIAKLGRQGDTLDGSFSANKFITDWNKLSSGGKDALFGSSGMTSVRNNLDQIAQLASSVKQPGAVSKVGTMVGHGSAAGVATFEAIEGIRDVLREGLSPGHLAVAGATAGAAMAGRLIASSMARPSTSNPLTQLITASAKFSASRAPEASQQMYAASARYAAALSAAYGVKVNPDDLVEAVKPKSQQPNQQPSPPP